MMINLSTNPMNWYWMSSKINLHRSMEYSQQQHSSSHFTPKWPLSLTKSPSSTPHASHSSPFSSSSMQLYIQIEVPSNLPYPPSNPYLESKNHLYHHRPKTPELQSYSPNYSQTGPPHSSTSSRKSTPPYPSASFSGNTPMTWSQSRKPNDFTLSLLKWADWPPFWRANTWFGMPAGPRTLGSLCIVWLGWLLFLELWFVCFINGVMIILRRLPF